MMIFNDSCAITNIKQRSYMIQCTVRFAFFVYLFAFASGCGEDESPAPLEPIIKVKGTDFSVSLENTNLYWIDTYSFAHNTGPMIYSRIYALTDGTPAEGGEFDDIAGYESATFHALIYLADFSESFTIGNFQQGVGWNELPVNGKYGIFIFETGEGNNRVYVDTNSTRNEFFKVTGGGNNGEVMKLEFDGTLSYGRYDAQGNQTSSDENVIISFEATVEDIRP
jgi:hypothetical protein